jgi:cell division protein FtsB
MTSAGFVFIVLCIFGVVGYFAWKADNKNKVDAKQQINDIFEDHTVYVASLDERQLAYYKSLGDSWYREMVKLEQRIHDLENKDLPQG